MDSGKLDSSVQKHLNSPYPITIHPYDQITVQLQKIIDEKKGKIWVSLPYFSWMSVNIDLFSVAISLTNWPLVNFNIIDDSVLQHLARQAPAAQDVAGARLAGYQS